MDYKCYHSEFIRYGKKITFHVDCVFWSHSPLGLHWHEPCDWRVDVALPGVPDWAAIDARFAKKFKNLS